MQLEVQEACHTSPSEIRCEDDIPETRRKLINKLKNTRNNIKRKQLEPVYTPNLGVRTCDPCPPLPRESVSTASDTINCRYENDGEEDDIDWSNKDKYDDLNESERHLIDNTY